MGRLSLMVLSLIVVICTFDGALGANVSSGQPSAVRWQTDYAQAHRLRVRHSRPMLVFVTTDGCPFCHKMLQTTYRDDRVAAEISATFVPMFMNAAQHQILARQFGVRIYPTTFLIGPDNRVLDRIEGFVAPEQFQERLTSASERIAATPTDRETR